MSLARLEATFWECVRSQDPPATNPGFVERAPLAAARRLGIYHQAYFSRQQAVLSELFPRARALLGDAEFFTAATEFVRRSPSRTPVIERIGLGFPQFLRDGRGHAEAAVDLARLEWAYVEAELSEDSEGELSIEELARLDATAIRVRRAPSVQLLRLVTSALSLWHDPASASAATGSVFVVVSRANAGVEHASLSEAAGRALELALQGHTLARAFSEFSGPDAIEQASRALAEFVRRKLWAGWSACNVET